MIRLTDPSQTAPTKRELVLAALASILALLALSVMGEDQAATTATSPDPMAACAEDDPCWDCQTMGNLICGRKEP